MLKTFRMFFFGLICHVGKDPQKAQADHAVLVNADSHEPNLVWHDDNNRRQVVPLKMKGAEVFIGSLSTRPVPYTTAFEKYTVKLSDMVLSKKGVRTQIRRRTDKKDVHAYVVYPSAAETLTVVNVYTKVGVHHTEDGVPLRRNCVARITMVTMQTDEDHVQIGHVVNKKWKVIAAVPTEKGVLFTDAEPQRKERLARAPKCTEPGHGHRGDHIKLFSKIAEDKIHAIACDTAVECHPADVTFPDGYEWVTEYIERLKVRASEYVECGNNRDP